MESKEVEVNPIAGELLFQITINTYEHFKHELLNSTITYSQTKAQLTLTIIHTGRWQANEGRSLKTAPYILGCCTPIGCPLMT